MNRIRFSGGYSAYYFDQTDKFFLDTFKKEVNKAFNDFHSLPEKNDNILNLLADSEKRPKTIHRYINYV